MIEILLATYNGEKYLSQQIDSILNQNFKDWVLLCRDDGSTDGTMEILKRYQQAYPKKIQILDSSIRLGSAKDNFSELLNHSTGDYIMFCDQDDVWLPEKIQVTFNKMIESEQRDVICPILVHTDMKVVDENLGVISHSFLHYQLLDGNRTEPRQLLVQNVVTGCTIMMNKSLVQLARQIPKEAIVHDWWVALIASVFGKITFIDQATILYRQHGANSIGAKKVKSFKYLMAQLRLINQVKLNHRKNINQAKAFFECFENSYSENVKALKPVNLYLDIQTKKKIGRIFGLIRYGYLRNSLIMKIVQITFC